MVPTLIGQLPLCKGWESGANWGTIHSRKEWE